MLNFVVNGIENESTHGVICHTRLVLGAPTRPIAPFGNFPFSGNFPGLWLPRS